MNTPDSLETNTTRPQSLLSSIPLQIMPGQTHPAHHIDFEHPGPVGILDIEKAFRLVDAEIVDEDVDLGELRRERRAALGAAEIDRRRMHLGIRRGLPDFGRGFSDRAPARVR